MGFFDDHKDHIARVEWGLFTLAAVLGITVAVVSVTVYPRVQQYYVNDAAFWSEVCVYESLWLDDKLDVTAVLMCVVFVMRLCFTFVRSLRKAEYLLFKIKPFFVTRGVWGRRSVSLDRNISLLLIVSTFTLTHTTHLICTTGQRGHSLHDGGHHFWSV